MPFDVSKISSTETNTLLDTVEKVGKAYAVVDANKFAVKLDDTAGDGFAMKKIGTGILHIGSASLVKTPVKTYIYEVEKN